MSASIDLGGSRRPTAPRRGGRSSFEVALGIVALMAIIAPNPGFGLSAASPGPTHGHAAQRSFTDAVATAPPIPPIGAAAKPFLNPPGWRTLAPIDHPSARFGSVEAYDPGLGALVLFGGEGPTGFLNDTWAYTGAPPNGDWTHEVTSAAPAARAFSSAVFDPALGGMIVFGGTGRTGPLGDTWLLKGTTWTQLASTGPSPRAGAALTYDPAHGQLVLFGGRNLTARLGDTWTGTGGLWTPAFPVTSPSARSDAVFAYDPGRAIAVLEGGEGASGGLKDTLDWNGSDWSLDVSAGDGSSAVATAFGYAAADGGLVVAGGNLSAGPSNGTVTLASAGSWVVPHLVEKISPRSAAAMGFSPTIGSLLLFGGWNGTALGDTWVYSTSTAPLAWRPENVSSMPSPRTQAAVAFDPASGYTVLFGGQSKVPAAPRAGPAPAAGLPDLNDTWIWRGGTWTNLSLSIAPPAREGAMMAFDPVEGALVLFGGAQTTPTNRTIGLNDTWIFRSGSWTMLPPGPSPSPRRGSGFTFDSADGFLVLYGGRNGSTPSSYAYYHDTWSFANGGWTRLTPTGKMPPAVSQPEFAFDPTSSGVILYGGFEADPTAGAPTPFPYTWSFSANHWANLSGGLGSAIPSARGGGAFEFDPAVGGLLLLGGNNASATFSDAWVFSDGAFTWVCNNCTLKLKDAGQVDYDDAEGALLAFGISSGTSGVSQTWLNLSRLTAVASVDQSVIDLGFASHFTTVVGGGVPALNGTWSFDDGSTNSSYTAVHTFATVGTHLATFRLVDGIGNVSLHTLVLTVETAPTAALAASAWGPGLYTGRFNATVTGGSAPFAYVFHFGDGSSLNSTWGLVQHTFAMGGSYAASVSVSDAYGQNATANAAPLVVPAVVPSVSIRAFQLVAASPVSIPLQGVPIDPYGGLQYVWGEASFPGTNFTHISLRSNGANGTLLVPKALALNATVHVWLNLTDGANFSASTSATLQILPAISGAISETILQSSGCPVQSNSTVIGLTENVSGGRPSYTVRWTVGSVQLTGPSVSVDLTPGTSVPVDLAVVDSVGDNYSISRTVLVPAKTCAPLSAIPERTLLIFGGLGAALVVVIALEVLYLHRRRVRSRPPPPPAPAESSATYVSPETAEESR